MIAEVGTEMISKIMDRAVFTVLAPIGPHKFFAS